MQTAALPESGEGPYTSAHTPSSQPSRSLLDRISKQPDDMEREEEEFIRSINRKRLELKRLWNSALPIHRLPNELLILLLAHFREVMDSYSRLNPGQNKAFRNGWQILMLVCRHWRDILVSTPAFWRMVDLSRQIDWTKLCLARSSPAHINVLVQRHARCPLGVIYPHARRFQTFFFEAAYSPQLQGALSYLFSSGMPLLEDFKFVVFEQSPPADAGAVDHDITLRRYPCLQALSLTGSVIVAPRDVLLYAQLRELSLRFCSHFLSFDEFIDALAACTQLEQLILSDTLHRLSGDWAHAGGPVPQRPPISLPRLREFTSTFHKAHHTSRFLAHLYLQPSVVLDIDAYFNGPLTAGEAPDLNTTKSIRAMLPPDRSATLPVLAVPTHIELSVTYDGYGIQCGHANANIVDPVGSHLEAPLSSFTVSRNEP